jgi:hypothetical protein
MSFKLLLIPVSIILVLVLMIGFIKPDITLLQEKQTAYETRLDQAKNMDTLLGNIDTLAGSLNDDREIERFVMDYFPQTMDEGRVIDAFNFLATQSGVSVGLMDLQALETAQQEAEAIAPPVVTPETSDAIVAVPVVQPVRAKSFSAKVSVKGSYEGIKDFFDRVAHMNRLHKTWDFSLATPEKTAAEAETNDTAGILQGSFEAAFDYVDGQTHQNALYAPVFSRGAFDLTAYQTTSDWVTNVVPSLEKPDAGRPNPFQ